MPRRQRRLEPEVPYYMRSAKGASIASLPEPHRCARCGCRIGLAVTPPPGAMCANCTIGVKMDIVREKHAALRERFEERFLIHMARIQTWFNAVEFTTLGPSVMQPSYVTPLAWRLNAWPRDLEDDSDRCYIDYRLDLWEEDRSSAAVWMSLVVLGRGRDHPGWDTLMTFRPGKERVQADDVPETERRFRQLTSDDAHAMIHETLSDRYGRTLVASPPPRTHPKVTP